MPNKPNNHTDITDPSGKGIGNVDTAGASLSQPSAGIPMTAVKGAANQVISVHGTIAGVVFDNQAAK